MSENHFTDATWYLNNSVYDTMKAVYNSAIQYDMLEKHYVMLKEEGDRCGHDSRMVVDEASKKIYVVHLVNTEDISGDSPKYDNNTYVRLNILSYDEENITKEASVILAKRGDSIDDTTINSGCGLPNLVMRDNRLYCVFEYFEDPTTAATGVCCYDLSDKTMRRNKCRLLHDGTIHDLNSPNLAYYVGGVAVSKGIGINADITYNPDDGHYYACACQWRSEVLKKGVILRTDDFVTWEYVCIPPITLPCNAEFEGSLAYFDGNYYFALRQNRPTAVGILAKFDSEWKLIEECFIPNCGSRSTFYVSRNGKGLYLINNAADRVNADIVAVDTETLTNSKVTSQISKICNYTSAYWLKESNNAWLTFVCGTTSPFQGVKVGAITTCRYGTEEVMSRFLKAFSD